MAIETHLGHRVVITENAGKQYVNLDSGEALSLRNLLLSNPSPSLIYIDKDQTADK